MTVKDMDICLNISTEPIVASFKRKQSEDNHVKSSVKKSKTQLTDKNADKKVSNDVSNKQVADPKKRVKQRFLSTIVARSLNSGNIVGQVQNVQKPIKTLSDAKPKNVAHSSSEHALSTKQTERTAKSISDVRHDIASESHISFTKVTKDDAGKAIVARKRNLQQSESKKSLSDIFSKKDDSSKDTKLSNLIRKMEAPEDDIPIKTSVVEQQKISATGKDVKKLKFKDKKEKSLKNKEDHTVDLDAVRKVSKPLNKGTGKISSLFGFNPEIPKIGQRLVKPVNEVVFTAKNFSDLDIHPFTVSNLEQNMNITKMTMVQQKAMPQIFSEKDVLIRSQTGSGKTLAYGIPIIELLHRVRPKLSRNCGLRALIIVPTRELALQTYEWFLKLVKPFTWIVPGYLVGGEKRKAEKARLRKGCNILIATPGRLLDHVKHTTALKLNDVKYFVLDEADRMFDMGYEKDISEIVSALKASSNDSNETRYDAMAMLKRNVKNVPTVEEMPSDARNISDECVEHDVEENTRQEYHSSSDSETETRIPTMSRKERKLMSSQKREKTIDSSEGTCEKLIEREQKNDVAANALRRQTILLSATLTQAVEKLAGLTMQNPIFVDAAKENLVAVAGNFDEVNEDLVVPQSVVQSYIITPPKLRMVTLAAYITGKCQTAGQHKILVFMATQDMVDYHVEVLSSVLSKPTDDEDDDSDPLVDVEFLKLHGSMSQKDRTEVFKMFRQARSGVLLCTDVAARGLDMPKVDCVIQYTGPLSAKDYVHRIGRTARAGSSGVATILLTPPEVEFVRMLESRRIRIKQEDMNDVLDKLLGPLSNHRSTQAAAIALQNEFETMVLEDKKLRDKAYKAYISWVRFYATYPRDMREVFDRKQLHLGHYAKSFALRDPPQKIGGIGKKLREQDISKPQHDNRLANERPANDAASQKKRRNQDGGRKNIGGLLKNVRMLNTSEYGSGLESMRKPKKS